jgi:uncharacterized protein
MGYKNFALVPGSFPLWNKTAVDEFQKQFKLVSFRTMELFRKGTFIKLKFFDEGCKALANNRKNRTATYACGAGRGMVLIDVNGDIWPCHRWSKKRESQWRLGSIYEPYFNYDARGYINAPKTPEQLDACRNCKGLLICAGGCPAENLEDTGTIHNRHPLACRLIVSFAELITDFHDTLLAEKNPVFMNAYYKNVQPVKTKVT